MEFLPLTIDGKQVYSNFSQRFRAGLIDFGVMLLIFPLLYLETISIPVAVGIHIFTGIIGTLYAIYFHANYGATVGKLVIGIRVVNIDGSKIAYKKSLLRSSVDIILSILIVWITVYSILNLNAEAFLSAEFTDRTDMIMLMYPELQTNLSLLVTAWFFSEFIVLLMNKRKRALHDFIAGTIVINKEFVIENNQSEIDEVEPLASEL